MSGKCDRKAGNLRNRANRAPIHALRFGIGEHGICALVRAAVGAVLARDALVRTYRLKHALSAACPRISLRCADAVRANLLVRNILPVARCPAASVMARILLCFATAQVFGAFINTCPVPVWGAEHLLEKLYEVLIGKRCLRSVCLAHIVLFLADKPRKRLVAYDLVQVNVPADPGHAALACVLPQVARVVRRCFRLARIFPVARNPDVSKTVVIQIPSLVQVMTDVAAHAYVSSQPSQFSSKALDNRTRLARCQLFRARDRVILAVHHIKKRRMIPRRPVKNFGFGNRAIKIRRFQIVIGVIRHSASLARLCVLRILRILCCATRCAQYAKRQFL